VAQRTCPYCKGDLPDGAVKCRSCGEWVDARWRLAAAGKGVRGVGRRGARRHGGDGRSLAAGPTDHVPRARLAPSHLHDAGPPKLVAAALDRGPCWPLLRGTGPRRADAAPRHHARHHGGSRDDRDRRDPLGRVCAHLGARGRQPRPRAVVRARRSMRKRAPRLRVRRGAFDPGRRPSTSRPRPSGRR
jgi:hypothetical protein